MSNLDAGSIRSALQDTTRACLDELDVFASLASTSTYLMSQAAPAATRFRAALADQQTAGRGRHHRRWVSPPGAGLYLSVAYSFARQPAQLPSLTLAVGVAVIEALREQGYVGVTLKWPNDIVARDGKLGGILTELQSRPGLGATVVCGIGLNVRLPADAEDRIESDWAASVMDLARLGIELPNRSTLAAAIIDHVHAALLQFGSVGFAEFQARWSGFDWLLGRAVVVEQATASSSTRSVAGTAAGVDHDGALLVTTADGDIRVVSGSVRLAGLPE